MGRALSFNFKRHTSIDRQGECASSGKRQLLRSNYSRKVLSGNMQAGTVVVTKRKERSIPRCTGKAKGECNEEEGRRAEGGVGSKQEQERLARTCE